MLLRNVLDDQGPCWQNLTRWLPAQNRKAKKNKNPQTYEGLPIMMTGFCAVAHARAAALRAKGNTP